MDKIPRTGKMFRGIISKLIYSRSYAVERRINNLREVANPVSRLFSANIYFNCVTSILIICTASLSVPILRQPRYAVDNEENADGVRCIAAPIFDAGGNVAAALVTSNTILHIDENHLPKIIELVKESAAQVSRRIGFNAKI